MKGALRSTAGPPISANATNTYKLVSIRDNSVANLACRGLKKGCAPFNDALRDI